MTRVSEDFLYRILDANLNRAAEGLRVCEEITRFVLNDRSLTAKFKDLRHKTCKVIDGAGRKKLIKGRDSQKDVGRDIIQGELKRSNYQDIFLANIQRVKESIRVLEEFYKLIDKKEVIKLKKSRYQVYELEKRVVIRLSTLSGIRQRYLPKRQN